MSDGLVVGGRYELKARLGRGGFGTVWQAHDATLRRDVAVKLLTVAPEDRDLVIARFWREAQAVASLNHPNIVTAHDFGVHEDYAYLVMELITGGSLADELAARRMGGAPPLDVNRVVALGAQVSAGLAAAHAAGLVHRDLKPANLMTVRPAGTIKIVDFGIAHVDALARLTKPGGYLGTLPYASPEQMAEGTVDGRSDLYSLGCLLYELLSDHSPYVAETPAQWIAVHQSATPTPLRTYVPAVPADLEALIHALLAKDPSGRPPSAEVVRDVLLRVHPAPPPRPTLVDSRLASPGTTAPERSAPALPAGNRSLAARPGVGGVPLARAGSPAPSAPPASVGPPAAAASPARAAASPARAAASPARAAASPARAALAASPPAGSPRAPVRPAPIPGLAAASRPQPVIAKPAAPGRSASPVPYYAWQPVPTPRGWVVVPQLVTPPLPAPPTTTIAARLLVVLSVAAGVVALGVASATVRVGRTAESAFTGVVSTAGTAVVLTMMFAVVALGIAAVLAGILAGSNRRGSSAGRNWTWILATPWLLIALSGLGARDAAVVAATPHGTDLARPRVVHALAKVRDAIPPWYLNATKLFDVIAAVILLLVVVLLALPPSTAYVRARRARTTRYRRV